MKKQMTKMAVMLILVIGLTVSAATAQVDSGGIASVGIYTGVETAPGTCEASTSVCYGNTFALNSYGEWDTYHLTLSLNYVETPNHNKSGMGIIGGSWSLVVYREGSYTGTLFGTVLDGNLKIITDNTGAEVSKQVQVKLNSTGGLGTFNARQYENISGALFAITDLRSRETQGSAIFNF